MVLKKCNSLTMYLFLAIYKENRPDLGVFLGTNASIILSKGFIILNIFRSIQKRGIFALYLAINEFKQLHL